MSNVLDFIGSFINDDDETIVSLHIQDKKIRENLSEQQIDKMIADSFPASDPPSTY